MYFDMQITKITPVLLCDPPIFRKSIFFQNGGRLNTKLEMVVFVLIVLYVTRLNLICAALLCRFVYQIYIVVEWRFVNDIDK